MNNAIVVVMDGLGASWTGPYGNTWVETGALNRLASRSLLLEFPMADSPHLDVIYRSYWQGLHALCSQQGRAGVPSLAERLSSDGVCTVLVTDEARVAGHRLADGFAEKIVLKPPAVVRAATDVASTQTAHLMGAAMDWLEQASEPFLLWVHARAMEGPWDAPYAYRRHFADEDDPDPPRLVAPPRRRLPKGYDPDELLGVMQAYAAQVVAADLCFGALLDAVEELGAQNPLLADRTLLTFTSARGFPLGEHGQVGSVDDALYGERLHVPWMVWLPQQRGAMQRSQALVQPPEMHATLQQWFQVAEHDRRACPHSLLSLPDDRPLPEKWTRACAVSDRQRAIRTPAWFLHAPEDSPPALYVKPDDRWEVNEISSRMPDVVDQLLEAFDQFQQAAQSGHLDHLPPLPEVLRAAVE